MTAAPHEPHIGLVVEGRGELFGAPVLLRKWLGERGEYRDILGKPVPCHGRDKAIAPQGIEGFVATAAARPGCVGVVALFDAEEDRPCERGPELYERASTITAKPVAVCLAEPKYEAWLVASAETLQVSGLEFRTDRDPVALIKACLPGKYVKPTWQPRLSSRVDFDVARPRAPSLDRTLRKLDELAALI